MALCRLFAIALFMLWAALVAAQDSPDYDAWLATADRAEDVIDAGRASSAALESLREEIANFREVFLEAREQNADRIETLEAQVAALGPAPEDAEEPEDIAELRMRLTDSLSELRVPRVVAEEAHSRANGLIAEIDAIIRERQTNQLLSRGPSPLVPTYWGEASTALTRVAATLVGETSTEYNSPLNRVQLTQNLPLVLFLAAIGSLLLTRGVHLAERAGDTLRSFGARGSGAWSFMVSLLRIALPLGGVFALTQAVSLTSLLGLRGEIILAAVPQWAAIVLLANWLGDQVFHERRGAPLIAAEPGRRRLARLLFVGLALMMVARGAIAVMQQIVQLSDGAYAVIAFIPIVLTSLMVLRLVALARRERLAREAREQAEDEDEDGPAHRAVLQGFLPLVRRVVLLIAVVAPLLAAAGYSAASDALIYPMVLTFALVMGIMILQRFIGDLYLFAIGRAEAGSDTLFHALVGFALALAALPLLALIWGARIADLTEIWTRFLEGFQVGESRISPVDFLTFVLVFVIGYTATRLLQSALRGSLLPKTRIDAGGQNAIVSGTGYVGIFLAALIAISVAGLDLSSLAIVAGALSVGIGFGLQTIVSNFVSGIILLVERPISKGDWIEVGGVHGTVRDISVRSTRIETFDRSDVIVPNSDLIAGSVTNYTRGNTVGRVILSVGVAYGTDTQKVDKILREIAEAHPMVLAKPGPAVIFKGFGADSLDFEIRAVLRDINWGLTVRSEMNHEINRRFVAEGIEIPFAQRDLWLRNPEALQTQTASLPTPTPTMDPPDRLHMTDEDFEVGEESNGETGNADSAR